MLPFRRPKTEYVVNEKTTHKVICRANHPALDPVVRGVYNAIDEGASRDGMLLKIRERHPSWPVFYYARYAVSPNSVIKASQTNAQIGMKSTITEPGPEILAELLVASSPLTTSGSAILSTLCPYVMFNTTPFTGRHQYKSASSSL